MQLDARQPLLAAGIIGTGIIISILICYRITKSWQRSSYITFLLLVYIFAEGHFVRVLESYLWHTLSGIDLLVFLFFWTLAFVFLTTNWVWKKIMGIPQFNLFMTFVMTCTLVAPTLYVGKKVINEIQNTKPNSISPYSIDKTLVLSGDQKKDIYIIILDSYGGRDVLRQLYDMDNSSFLTALEQRGFFIADDSRSNYVQTTLSIGSLMNFDYVSTWDPPTSVHEYHDFLQKIITENNLTTRLKKLGYQIVSFDSGYFLTGMPESDLIYSKFLYLNPFESILLSSTPLLIANHFQALPLPLQDYVTHSDRVLYTFDKLGSLPTSDRPRLISVHILSPHPPFVFQEDGTRIDPPRPFETLDADQYLGTTEEYINGYRNQVAYINGLVLKSIDGIINNSKAPPIIVIIGDHGPGSQFHWDPAQMSCLWERTSILTAILLPNESSGLYPSISPVNIFRVILNQYFGTGLPILKDRSYYSTDQNLGIILDVTTERDDRTGCSFNPFN
ncbi:MAG: sulfatase-like hydrolase/transferase [Anaerolineaceae bacterium]